MARYEKRMVDGRLRLQFELVVEQAVRKALTLEQVYTVFCRSARPEQITRKEFQNSTLDSDDFFTGQSPETWFNCMEGEWSRAGRTMHYYMDDAVMDNRDGTLTAVFLWWEVEADDAEAEAWFDELCKAVLAAQENLELFGRI